MGDFVGEFNVSGLLYVLPGSWNSRMQEALRLGISGGSVDGC